MAAEDIEMSKSHQRNESDKVGLIPDEVQKEGGQDSRKKTYSALYSSCDSILVDKSAIKFNNFMADLKRHNKVAPMPTYEDVRGVNKVAVMLEECDISSEDAVVQSARRGTSEDTKQFMALLNQSKQLVQDLRKMEEQREAGLQKMDMEASLTARNLVEKNKINQEVEADENVTSYFVKKFGADLNPRAEEELREADSEFADFMRRKETIITVMGDISKMKFKDQPDKQEVMMDLTREALDEQQREFDNQGRRATILKKTQQELEGNQDADFKYRVYRLSVRSLTQSNKKK